MDDLRALLVLTLVPALAALGAAAAARRLTARSQRTADTLLALGVAAGFVAALHVVGTRPAFPLESFDDAWKWVVWVAPAGVVLGAALLASRLPERSAVVVRWVFGAAAAWLIVRALVPHALSLGEALAHAGAWGAGAALLATAVTRRARTGDGVTSALPLLVALLGTTVVLLRGGLSPVMAEAGLALTSAVAATALLAGWARVPTVPRTAAPAVAAAFVGLLAGAHAYLARGANPRFPLTCALLLLGAACGVLLPRRWGLVAALLLAGSAAALFGRWEGPSVTY